MNKTRVALSGISRFGLRPLSGAAEGMITVTAITLGAGVLIIAVVGMAPLLLAAGGLEGRAPRH